MKMQDRNPKVAIIVLTWNRREEVLKTLDLLEKDDYPNKEVIVIDNASTDGTREAVLSRYPNVKVISLPYNLGISGWDFGIVNTDAEYVVCLDDDSSPDPGAISRMVKVFEADPRIGIVPFNIYGGAFATEDWAKIPTDNLVGYINCGVGLRKEAVIKAGFNDPDFFLYANEWDLAIRILNKGYRIAFDPAIRANHRTSAMHRSYKRLRTLTARNEAWMVLKYFPLVRIPRILCRVLFWNAISSRKEGILSFWYAIYGVATALWKWRVAWVKREKIKPEILERYERNFWSFRPIPLFKLVRYGINNLLRKKL
jgi:GT2 family glycosyltransferase